MAGTEGFYDPNTKRYESRKTADEGDVAGAQAKADMQDASKLKPKPTGRGMRPGETVDQWKQRLQDMDNEKEAQVRALSKND